MKIRPVDSIYLKRSEKQDFVKSAKPEIQPIEILPTKKPKRRFWRWILGGAFLVLFIFGLLFWYGLLGEKLALIRLFLGLNGKYLILFQNNTELRPSGGFIGSFAEIEIKNGLIKNWYFDTNIYKRDKTFTAKTCIPSPPQAQVVWGKGCMNMANSNWSPDFQEAASDVEWYYKQEGGNTVNGVIALDTSLFTDLLKLIGPIEMPQYNLTLTADNFVQQTQYYVEKEYYEDPENKQMNEPKTILKDMMPEVLTRLKNPKLTCALLTILKNNLAGKHLLFSFKNPWATKISYLNNWGGSVKNTQGDYLYVNNTNLGGGKSSLNIKQTVTLKTKIQDSSVLDTLTIIRTHQGDGIWPDATNQNYTRILLPKGSILQDKKGIEEINFNEELGKTVLGFWSTVSPGETRTFEITYTLPFSIDKKYQLLVQKQPGALEDQFYFLLENEARWKWEGSINQDKFIEVNLTKN